MAKLRGGGTTNVSSRAEDSVCSRAIGGQEVIAQQREADWLSSGDKQAKNEPHGKDDRKAVGHAGDQRGTAPDDAGTSK